MQLVTCFARGQCYAGHGFEHFCLTAHSSRQRQHRVVSRHAACGVQYKCWQVLANQPDEAGHLPQHLGAQGRFTTSMMHSLAEFVLPGNATVRHVRKEHWNMTVSARSTATIKDNTFFTIRTCIRHLASPSDVACPVRRGRATGPTPSSQIAFYCSAFSLASAVS